jgi:hypothetical protein
MRAPMYGRTGVGLCGSVKTPPPVKLPSPKVITLWWGRAAVAGAALARGFCNAERLKGAYHKTNGGKLN